jgi:hypothetical protein
LPETLFSQRIPVNLTNYDNITTIDNYFEEVDSLILKYRIQRVNIFYENDSSQLIEQNYFNEGKLLRSVSFDIKTGKPLRIINYSRPSPNILEAEFFHYPSSDNYNIFPSRTYSYLWIYSADGKNRNLRYKRDSLNVVYMKIKYQWLDNGDILYQGYDKDGIPGDSFLMKKLNNPKRYQEQQHEPQEYISYNSDSSVKLNIICNNRRQQTYWKECYDKNQCREYKYSYSESGLLMERKYYQYGKLFSSYRYEYQ